MAAAAPQGFNAHASPNAPANPDAQAETLRSEAEVGPESYNYAYKTSNNIEAQEKGELHDDGENKAIVATGSFKFTAPDGIEYEITYIADKNGFQPTGAHIPTPSPEVGTYPNRTNSYNFLLAIMCHNKNRSNANTFYQIL